MVGLEEPSASGENQEQVMSEQGRFLTTNPRIPEKSDKAYRQNRRVEFKITREKKDVVHTDAVPTAPAPAKEGERQ